MTLRGSIREVLGDVAPDISPKNAKLAERKMIKGVVTILVRDGYTLPMCADALDVPVTTLKSWRDRDEAWKAQLAEDHEQARRWLLAACREHVEKGGKAAGPALKILAHLLCPELRSSKVEATVQAMPNAGEARGAVLGILNKSKPLELARE